VSAHHLRPLLLCLVLVPAQLALAADPPDPAGRPRQFEVGKHTTFAVWESEGTWYLRSSSKPNAKGKAQFVEFSGTVRVTGDILIGEFQGLEKSTDPKAADHLFVHKDRKGFDFRFSTYSKNVDGVTFKLGPKAEAVTFKLRVQGDDDPKKILIGKEGARPEKAEFTFPVAPAKAK
jgi:hypothetical protein